MKHLPLRTTAAPSVIDLPEHAAAATVAVDESTLWDPLYVRGMHSRALFHRLSSGLFK